jgi:LysM repeat protein
MFTQKITRRIAGCLFCLLSFFVKGQVKSTNIQTLDGKKYYIHKIEKGQSIYAISKTYGVGLEEIYNNNPELKSGARANQEIKIPVLSQSTASVSGQPPAIDTSRYYTYKVQKGETIYSLQKKVNLTEKQLIAYNPALAQGLKEGQVLITGEKNKKKREARENKPVITAKEYKSVPAAIDSFLFKPISKPRKPKYNISLMLPFKFDATLSMDLAPLVKNNSNFPAVSSLAIDFYLGFKRAVDSLKSPEFEINLNLYDIDDSDSLLPIMNSQKFKEADCIFGPLYANGFKIISKKAKELAVPIVSPLTQQNKILFNNIYVSKTNPSHFTLLESLAEYCIDSLMQTNANLIVVNSGLDKKENAYVAAFKKYFNDKQKELGKNLQDTLKIAKGVADVKTAYVPNVKNIVITLSNNQVFITDFTTQLALFAVKNDIVLCGWESISTMDNIDQEYLNQLGFTFPHQFNITNKAAYRHINEAYKAQLGTTPGEYYFIGFDVAYYYLKQLKDNGPDFIYRLDTLPMETNFMRFKFARPDNTTGFDNRGV